MSNISDMQKLFRMAGKVKRFIILTILRSPFDPLQTAIQASFLQFAFVAINKEKQIELFQVCTWFAIGTFFLFLYNGTIWTIYSAYVTRWVSRIRYKIFHHISCLSLQQIEGKSTGEWITRLNTDVYAATAILNKVIHLPHAVVSISNISVSSIILLIMEPRIFGLIIIFIIPHVIISQIFVARPMALYNMEVQEVTATNTTDMNALVICAETAILYDAQDFLLERFEKSSLEIRKANMKIQHRKAIGSGLLPLMGLSGYLVVLLIGGNWVAAGAMTFGALTAAFQYRAGLLKSMNMLIDSLININSAMAGVRRVNETMSIKAED